MDRAIRTLGAGLRGAAWEVFGTRKRELLLKGTTGRNGCLRLIDLADLDAAISRQPSPRLHSSVSSKCAHCWTRPLISYAFNSRGNQARGGNVRKLIVFNHVSLDGYFVDGNGDMSWARKAQPDTEWNAFVAENAAGGVVLLFGRITYELMASYWPTPLALKNDPKVAEGMNSLQKVVFSRTLDKASWKNTKLVKGNLVEQVRKMKAEPGEGMAILGSGSIVSQLAQEGLIDEYQIVLNPVVLGKGRTMFEGIKEKLSLKLIKTRTFGNGSVVLWYEPQA